MMRGGAYTRGAYTWTYPSVKKRWAVEEPIRGGARLIGREIQY